MKAKLRSHNAVKSEGQHFEGLKAAPRDACLRFGGSKRGLGVETLEDIAM